MNNLKIAHIERFSMIDYPGRLSAVIFTQGCNFRCPYCHNPELVLPHMFTEPLPVGDVLGFLKQRQGKLDAITITGGEPTLHAGLPEFIRRVRSMGFLVKLDTNGTNPKMLTELVNEHLVDYYAMDLKGPAAKYNYVTKRDIDIDAIKQSVKLLQGSGALVEFRTTLVDVLLNEQDVLDIRDDFGPLNNYSLQNFRADKTLDTDYAAQKTFTQEAIGRLRDVLRKTCASFVVR